MPLPFASVDPPSPIFTIGALAIAARRANAIGAVRLTAHASELEIELIRVAGFAEGFAPGAVASAVCFKVPYLAVRGLVQKGRMLYLTLDPVVAVPYNRFALVRFSDDPAEVLARAYRARAEARWASYLLPGPLGLLTALLSPSSLVSGWLGRASLGLLIALALFAGLREIVAFRTWGGPISDHYRDMLEAELSRKLGLLPPAPAPAPDAGIEREREWERGRPAEGEPSPPARIGRIAIAVGLVAAGVVGAMAFLQRYAAPHEPPPAVPLLATGLAAVVQRVRLDPSVVEAPRARALPRCSCDRADSPLWKDGVPTLSILMWSGENEADTTVAAKEGRGGAMKYNFDLAVVNNAERPQQDVTLTLTFARRNKKGNRVAAVDRGLFWGGALAPGRAVKWHVSAPGTEMRVDASVTGTLDEAHLEPASPDAFFELTKARFRPVRVHAATMLAYLRDPRADDAVRALGEGGTPDEKRTLDRIRHAAAPVFACRIAVAEGTRSACVFNGASRPKSGLLLNGAPVPSAIPVHDGVEVSMPVEGPVAEEWVITEAPNP